MRRIVNFRAPLFATIGLILGIISFYEVLFGDLWFGLVTLVLIFALGVVLFIVKSKSWRGVLVVIAAIMLGFALSQLNYSALCKNEVTEKEVLLTGRVCDLERNGGNEILYYLEDCVDDEGVSYGGRVKTAIFGADYQTGEVLTVRGTIYSVYPVKPSPQSYYLRQGVSYELDAKSAYKSSEAQINLSENIRKYFYETTAEYAPNNGDVLYALLTGDRSALSHEKEDYFKLSGIIHLLAVSGLHVGFVVSVLGFFLKRFKLHPLIEGGIMLIPLCVYAYICNFTPSVIRALVMTVCVYLTRSFFGRYDLLTSLSFAVTVILLISPFNLFDVGFQLSALSVFGIATVFRPVNRFLNKRNLPKIIRYAANSATVSFSCSLATFFTLQCSYGYAPVLGILINVLIIPIVTVAFVLSWLGLVPWIFHYILRVVDWIVEFVVVIARWASGISFATVSMSAIAITTVVVAIWLFVIGGYVNFRKIGKIIIHSVLAAVLALCVGLSYVKLSPTEQAFVSYGYSDAMCVVTSSNGETAIVGNFGDVTACSEVMTYVTKYKIIDCTLYITDISECNVVLLDEALRSLPVKTVYKLNFADNAEAESVIDGYGIPVYQQMQNSTLGDYVAVTSVYDGGLRAVVMRTGKMVLSTVYGDDYAVGNYLELGLASDVYILPNANKRYSENNCTTLSYYQSSLPLNYGANKYGTFTITQKGDTISIKFR